MQGNQTVVHNLTGSNGIVPIVAPISIKFPTTVIKDFPSCCGAGSGIGNTIVPETLFLLRISAACFVHDAMWNTPEPTWQYFHFSNSVFLNNLLSIVNVESDTAILRKLRKLKAQAYYEAVNTVGAHVFWGIVEDMKQLEK